jgi:hypothetical protein
MLAAGLSFLDWMDLTDAERARIRERIGIVP